MTKKTELIEVKFIYDPPINVDMNHHELIHDYQNNRYTLYGINKLVQKGTFKEVRQQQYVLGFMFSEDKSNVLLLLKLRPPWQFGKLNGIGGKIKRNENPIDAMVREFEEETGIITETKDWSHKFDLGGDNNGSWRVSIFASYSGKNNFRIVTDEIPVLETIKAVLIDPGLRLINNLRWIVPLCLDKNIIGGNLIDGFANH